MEGEEQHHLHLNVLPVWEQGLSGRGVSVAILDDNVNPLNPDISHNYVSTYHMVCSKYVLIKKYE